MIPIVLFILQRSGGSLAGAKVDWISQHVVFPEYFRELFYKTGNIFPQFAAEIGGGQNIYNYAYYGLCNPLYWISYLFPFVNMTDYVQVLSLLGGMADGVLCYLWLGRHYDKKYSFFGALVLVLALPVTYHSSAQIMFVNYIPFLLLAFIGYDRYCRTSKYGLLTDSIVMMILISFYFAVGGLAALCLYAASGWRKEQASSLGVFVKCAWHQFYPMILGGFLSMFYLVPVFFAMMQGRSGGAATVLKELLVPDVSLHKFLYSPYGLGVGCMAVIAVCTSVFYKKCREKWLGMMLAVVVIFPLFVWVLNGGLYVRDKALIPLIPLVCYLSAGFFQRIGEKNMRGMTVLGGTVLGALVLCLGAGDVAAGERLVLYTELVVCGAALFISFKGSAARNASVLVMTVIMAAGCLFQFSETKDGLVTEDFAGELNHAQTARTVERILEEDDSLYRMEVRGDDEYNKANQNRVLAAGQNLTTSYSSVNNAFYHSFRNELGLSKSTRNNLMEDTVDNPVFLRFMGVKYLVGQTDTGGYEKEGSVYKNGQAAPMFYLTGQTITEKQFESLSWPQKQLTLLENAVAGDEDGELVARLEPVSLVYAGDDEEQKITVDSKETVTKTIPLSQAASQDTYLFLSFSIHNLDKKKDVSVTVNGQKNKLSGAGRVYYNANEVFHYTCAVPAGTEEITIEYGAGHYEISNIQCFFGREDGGKQAGLYRDILDMSLEKRGDGYEGTAHASADGWLITSIPYDKGFHIYIDGRETESRRVNKAFLGARVTEGRHEVRIVYEAPGWKLGLFVSGIAGAVLLADGARKRRKKYANADFKI